MNKTLPSTFVTLPILFTLAFLISCGGGGDDGVAYNPPPAQLSGVVATSGDGQVSVSWNSSSSATSYNLYWGTSPGITIATGTSIQGVTSPYVHAGLTNGITYYYVLTALNQYGESVESSEVSATPVAPLPGQPTGVSVTAGEGQNIISWEPVDGATSYNLYWKESPGVTKYTGIIVAGITSPYSHTGLTNGTTYYYVVTAVDQDGEGIESLEVSGTPEVAQWKTMSAGSDVALAITTDGDLWAWGGNITTPVLVDSASVWADVSASGSTMAMAIKSDGTMWEWEGFGKSMVQVGTDSDWDKVSSRSSHTMAIKTDNTLWGWGQNDAGQLGIGNTTDKSSPTLIGSGWAEVSSANWLTLGLKTNGFVFAWGSNLSGELGTMSFDTCFPGGGYAIPCSTYPILVTSLNPWSVIEAGKLGFSLGIYMDLRVIPTIMGWGQNNNSVLGAGGNRSTPASFIGGFDDWIDVTAGSDHAVAMKSDGSLWAWGNGSYLGVGGGAASSSVPVQVLGAYGSGYDYDWVAISAHVHYTLALKSDGSLWAWGDNYYGQLGDGSTTDRFYPVRVEGY